MPHPALLFILLLLPNTTLRDWQRADAPHLHAILRDGSVALMNARTAQTDRITPEAACSSLGAGARMNAPSDVRSLAYPVQPGNLALSLRAGGVEIETIGPLAQTLTHGISTRPTAAFNAPTSDAPTLVVCDLGSDLANADPKIGGWLKIAKSRQGEIMVVSPCPTIKEYRDLDQLTPVVLWSRPRPAGLLFSPSTRHLGLVTNTDIAPEIADFFHAPLTGPAYGASVQSVPLLDGNGPQLLERADEAWMTQARALRALPYVAGTLAMGVALLGYLYRRGTRGLGTGVLLVALVPLVLLLSGTLAVAGSLLISALACAYLLRDRLHAGLLYIGALTAVLVTGDALLSSGQFTATSLLGYSPLEGARYYGIGNEAMGAVIGAGVVLTMGLLPRPDGRHWCALVWVVITATLAWPTAGAKAGGLLVGLIALAALFAASSGRSWKDVRVWGSLFAALALGIAGLWLIGRYGARSHLTLATESAVRHGSGVYGSLLLRKGMMDAHLVVHSVWIWVLLAAAVSGFLALRGRWLHLATTERASVFAGCAATAACLALNDAGVVAAAVCSLFLWAVCIALSETHGPSLT